jgi:hypothetical protein
VLEHFEHRHDVERIGGEGERPRVGPNRLEFREAASANGVDVGGAPLAQVDRSRLLEWILAYAGLSAAWTLAAGDDPALALAVAEIAAAALSS